jgi:hypothetical protein
MKRQTAFEQNLRLLARRLDQGYPLTDELKAAIADVVGAAARSARGERGPEYGTFGRATEES